MAASALTSKIMTQPMPPDPIRSQSSDSNATDPEPNEDEIERLGANSLALSELSDNIEHEEYPGRPKSKGLSGWVQVIRPMVQGRFMWTLTISNFILFILMLVLVIYIFVFVGLIFSSIDKRNELRDKIETVDYCSVNWHPLTDCSAKCKEIVGEVGNRTSYIEDVTGSCPDHYKKTADELKEIKYNVPCNVWACE